MLITDMFTYNPHNRPAMSEVLKADWFQKMKQEMILPKIGENMVTKALSNMNKFKVIYLLHYRILNLITYREQCWCSWLTS